MHLPRQGEILRASKNGHHLALAAAQAHPRPSEHAVAVALKVRARPPEERQRGFYHVVVGESDHLGAHYVYRRPG